MKNLIGKIFFILVPFLMSCRLDQNATYYTKLIDVPVGEDKLYEMNEDSQLEISYEVLPNEDSINLELVIDKSPANGELKNCVSSSLNSLVCTYVPKSNFFGNEEILIKTKDGDILSKKSSKISINVLPIPDSPMAPNKMVDVFRNQSTLFGFPKAVDVDSSEENLTYEIVKNPTYGSLSSCNLANGNKGCIYQLQQGQNIDKDEMEYRVIDETSNVSNVAKIVFSFYDLADGSNLQLETYENQRLDFNYEVAGNNLPDLELEIVSGPSHGQLTGCTLSQVLTIFECSYIPNNGYVGSDSISVKTKKDNIVSNNQFVISINVIHQPVAPIASNSNISGYLSKVINFSLPQATDSDTSSQNLSYQIVQGPSHGSLSNCSLGLGNRSCSYQANLNYYGADMITYKVIDSDGLVSNTASISVEILDFPIGENMSLSLYQNESKTFEYILPSHSLSLDLEIVTSPSHGQIQSCVKNSSTKFTCTYKPNTNYLGADSLEIKTKENGILSTKKSSVSINVIELGNNAPVSSNGSFSTYLSKDKGFLFPSATDVDTASNLLRYEIVQSPSHGTLQNCSLAIGTRSCSYKADTNFSGTDVIRYKVIDDKGAVSNISDMSISVIDFPIGPNLTISTPKNTPITFNYTIPNNSLSLDTIVSTSPSHGQVSSCTKHTSTTFSCIYTPAQNYTGNDTFYLKTKEGQISSIASSSVSVSIQNVYAPVASNKSVNVNFTSSVSSFLSATDQDSSQNNLTFVISKNPSHGVLSNCNLPTGNKECTYTHNGDFVATDSIEFYVFDEYSQNSNTATVTFNISTPLDGSASFVQQAGSEVAGVDIVWVIDDSGSMSDDQERLKLSFSSFINNFLVNGSSRFPFRMGVISTGNYLNSNSDFPFEVDANGDPYDLTHTAAESNFTKFKEDFKEAVNLGSAGSNTERAFESMKKAYDYDPAIYGGDDRLLVYVVLSDEGEQSYPSGLSDTQKTENVSDWYDTFSSWKNYKDMIKVYPIIKISEDRFSRYSRIAELTGTSLYDINDSFDNILNDISFQVKGLMTSFLITSNNVSIIPNTVNVKLNGVPVSSSSWTLSNRRIVFNNPPAVGTTIDITYKYY